jgi:Glycosyl hydrolase family 12
VRERLTGMRALTVALVIAAVWSVAAQGMAAASDTNDKGRTLCAPRASVSVMDAGGARYAIKNDNYAGRPECLSGLGPSPSFRVSRSPATSSGSEPESFPEIFVGCTWGRCSPDSPLPARVSALRDPETSWDTSEQAGGVWDASYDLWFNRKPIVNGQATGAEIMIWLNWQGTGSATGWPIVTLDGTRWYLVTWITHGHGTSWQYISFRRVDHVWNVSSLRLRPFISLAEQKGWINSHWYMLNIEAGFEIWRGGTGLATKSFSART